MRANDFNIGHSFWSQNVIVFGLFPQSHDLLGVPQACMYPLSPALRILCLMKHSKNNNRVFFANEEDSIGKMQKQCAPYVSVDTGKSSGVCLDRAKGITDRNEKFLTKTRKSILIPCVRLRQIRFTFR